MQNAQASEYVEDEQMLKTEEALLPQRFNESEKSYEKV